MMDKETEKSYDLKRAQCYPAKGGNTMKQFRKFYYISLILILALSLAGCTEKQEGENWNLSLAGYPSPLDREFTPVDLAGEAKTVWLTNADMCQIDEDTVLLNFYQETEIVNSVETTGEPIDKKSLCLYDFKKAKSKKKSLFRRR